MSITYQQYFFNSYSIPTIGIFKQKLIYEFEAYYLLAYLKFLRSYVNYSHKHY